MRPNQLNPLFARLTSLPGVGPKQEKLFARLLGREEAGPRILDLLFHLPTGAIDRRARPKLRDVVADTVVTVAVTVDLHRPPPPNRPRAPYQIYVSDETGDLILTFFNARKDYLQKLLPVGEQRYVSGTVARPIEWAVRCASSHSSVVTLSGQMTARTSSSRISAAVPGRVASPASLRLSSVNGPFGITSSFQTAPERSSSIAR